MHHFVGQFSLQGIFALFGVLSFISASFKKRVLATGWFHFEVSTD